MVSTTNHEKIRYIVFFAVIVIAMLFGRNFETESANEANLKNALLEKEKIIEGEYRWPGVEESLILPGVRADHGHGYRLWLDLQVLSDAPGLWEQGSDTIKTATITIYAMKGRIKEKDVGSFEVVAGKHYFSSDQAFWADKNITQFLFEKNDPSFQNTIIISSVRLQLLNVDSHEEMAFLSSSVVGRTNIDQEILPSNLNKPTKEYRFFRENQFIGQTFESESEQIISAAEFSLAVVRSGGSGKYLLALYELNSNGEINQTKGKIAYFYFDRKDLEGYLVGDNRYRLPLPANLEKGKRYVAGISNAEVRFNYLNTLVLRGFESDENKSGQLAVGKNGKLQVQDADLHLQLLGAVHQLQNGEKIPTGLTLEDLGKGKGQLSYLWEGEPKGFLDLEGKDLSLNHSVVYDGVQRGISGLTDISENSFSFSFPIEHPADTVEIKLEEVGAQFTRSKVFYSFNTQEWQEIPADKEGSKITSEFFVIRDKVPAGKVKIRVIPDPKDTIVDRLPLFGIKSLEVTAEINLKSI